MRRVSILLAGLLLAGLLLVGGCGSGPSSPAPPAPPAVGASGAGSRHSAADVAFVRALIPHHQQGIGLASAAAERPAARTLASAIIVTQQDEVVRMTGWLREWSSPAPPSPSAAPATGDPIRALIAHQEQAIELAQQEQAGGTNPAALAYAKQVVESRTEEIAQLRALDG